MAVGLAGCIATVHAADPDRTEESEKRLSDTIPVAVWWTGQIQDEPEPLPSVRTRQLVIDVLSEHGLHPSHDLGGVQVSKDERQEALEVLVTDDRLLHAELEVSVIFFVQAGTGRRTESGFEVPVITPFPDHPDTVIEPK